MTSKLELKEHDELLVDLRPSPQHTWASSFALVEASSSQLGGYHQSSETGTQQSHSHFEGLVLYFGWHLLDHHWAVELGTCV